MIKKIITSFILIFLVFPYIVLAANSHSTDLEADSTQYWSKSGSATLRQKNDFSIEMMIKFESLPTSGNQFWLMDKKSESGEDFSMG